MRQKSKKQPQVKKKHGNFFCLNYVRVVTLATLVLLVIGAAFTLQLDTFGRQVLGANASCSSLQDCQGYNLHCLLSKWFGNSSCGSSVEGTISPVPGVSLPPSPNSKVF